MNIKQFLKPDWRKIAITIVIVTIEILDAVLVLKVPIITIGVISAFYVDFSLCGDTSPLLCRNSRFAVSIGLINILFYYLLSCLIVWIYDKIKVKKK